jgi:hypothetical protein
MRCIAEGRRDVQLKSEGEQVGCDVLAQRLVISSLETSQDQGKDVIAYGIEGSLVRLGVIAIRDPVGVNVPAMNITRARVVVRGQVGATLSAQPQI